MSLEHVNLSFEPVNMSYRTLCSLLMIIIQFLFCVN
jgi:hypothetical protein